MNNTDKNFIALFTLITITLIFCQSNVEISRRTAITRAIEKVGPSVAFNNVQQNVSSFSTQDPFFRYFFPLELEKRKIFQSLGLQQTLLIIV